MSNVQPLVVETLHGLIAVAHNGELYNAKALKDKVGQINKRYYKVLGKKNTVLC